MKTKKELKKNLGKLNQFDLDTIRDISSDLAFFKDKKEITEEGLRKLENCLVQLETLKNSYSWRIIRLLKQGHMLD